MQDTPFIDAGSDAAPTRAFSRLASALASLAAATVLVGCGTSSGFERADNSAQIARDISSNIQETQSGVQRANDALGGLLEPPREEPRTRLDAFQSGLNTAEQNWRSVNERMRELQRQTSEYFSDWEEDTASLGSEDMRSTARQRRSQQMAMVQRMQAQFEDTRLEFAPYLERMRNLNQLLTNDFTSEGIRAAEDVIYDLRQQARRQQNSLENLLFEVNEVAGTLAVAG